MHIEGPFKEGDHVVYRPYGVARIIARVVKESTAGSSECFALDLPSGVRAFIPVERATTMLRPLSSKQEAESDLEVLRSEGVEADTRLYRARQEERERILRTGSREEITTLLRRLYAKKTPASDADARAIRALEDLVLSEIAVVLGVGRDELEMEMRNRYPVLREKKTKE